MIAVIFDIDGTLLDSCGFDKECYVRAVRRVLGDVVIREDWGDYGEVTAAAIVEAIMRDNRIPCREGALRAVRKEFGKIVSTGLRNGGSIEAKRGARGTVETLMKNRGACVGVATGDWGHTAGMKLRHARIPTNGLPLASCDDGNHRTEIMSESLSRMGASFRRILYVGDGDWDMRAALALGWDFVGVGPRLRGKCATWVECFDRRFHQIISS